MTGSLPIRCLTKEERKGLTEALSHLREGDTLVVSRLDRLGRSLRNLIDTVTELHSRGVGFKNLQENIDTTTSDEVQLLNNMASDKSLTVSDICKTLGIGRTTFYRYVKARERE